MGLRCWPGCLAYITDAEDERTRGALVEVVRRADIDDEDDFGPSWIVKARSELVAFVGDDEVLAREVIAPDCCLRPITPPPAAETADTREPIAAEV